MSPVYLDPTALRPDLVPGGELPAAGRDALGHLVDAGFRVILVLGAGAGGGADAGGSADGSTGQSPGAPDPHDTVLPTGVNIGAREELARAALPDGVECIPALPDRLEPGDWFIAGEPHPAAGRPRGGRTILVGPRRPPGPIPPPRFDLEARDLAAASMEILTRDAMT